jgi:PAS domain S-box-containing protein
MSIYQGAPQGGGGLGQNQIQLSGTAPDLSLLDPTDIMGGPLDLDMSLPMDLDMDFSGTNTAQAGFATTGVSVDNAISSRPLDADLMGAAINANNGFNDGDAQQSFQQQNQQQFQGEDEKPQGLSGPGAGPLPTTHGMQNTTQTTLTEFTKRRNWSQRIIEELRDFLHILTPDGRILYVSPSCRSITGYEPQQIIGKFIGEFVHPDDTGIFMREFNESIASGNALRFFYRFKKEDGNHMIFECHGHPHISPGEPESQSSLAGKTPAQIQNTKSAGVCRGFFMMARPYPTKNAALLDSFLEHKIENERLLKRIGELKREELEEQDEQDRIYAEQIAASPAGTTPMDKGSKAQKTHGDATPDETRRDREPTPNYQGMPPPAKPTISNTALTRQNLSDALSGQKTEGIADKMSRYESSGTHLESIELLTGLRYRDGERSHGISTGDTSPALIRGDAGIAILLDRDRERDGSKKDKKKLKVADEYVCSDCGTLDSPEWRKGPKGPKTLCNACGLRWAKKEKKRTGVDVDGKDNSPMGSHGGLVPSLPKGHSAGSD